MKHREISQTVKTPQVNQTVEISLWDSNNGRKNYFVKIIKIKTDNSTNIARYLYLCEYENLERLWYGSHVIVWESYQ